MKRPRFRWWLAAVLVTPAFVAALLIPHPRSVPDPTGEVYGKKIYEWQMKFIGRDVVQWTTMTAIYVYNTIRAGADEGKEARRWQVRVDKAAGRMTIERDGKRWRQFKCVTGREPGNRRKDGDGRTPTGSFRVIHKRIARLGKNPRAREVFFNTIWYPNIIIHESTLRGPSDGCIGISTRNLELLYDSLPLGAALTITE